MVPAPVESSAPPAPPPADPAPLTEAAPRPAAVFADAPPAHAGPAPLPAPSRSGRILLVAALMGALAAAAFIAGLVVRAASDQRMSVLVVAAALLLGIKVGVDRVARWAAPSQGVVATSLAAASLAPLFVMGALSAAADPLVAATWRCGTGEMNALLLAPVAFFLLAALGTLVAAGVLAGGRGEAFRPLIRGLAIFATAVTAALVLFSLGRAARKPDIDLYIDSLPVTATLPPLADSGRDGTAGGSRPQAPEEPGPPQRPTSEGDDEQTGSVHTDAVGDLVVYRACKSGICGVVVGNPGVDRKLVWRTDSLDLNSPPGAELTVHRDDAHHFVLITGRSRRAFGHPDYFPAHWNTEDSELRLWPAAEIGVRTVADAASPPLAWWLGGSGGLLVAGALLLTNALRARRLRAVLAGASGMLGDNGLIHFDDDRPPVRVDPRARIAPGPVLVAPDGAVPRDTYRSDGPFLGASRLLSGTREEWTERHAARAADLHAWAIATAMLAGAPLFAAMMAGLVVG
jgi:hypothetical protein